MPLTEKQLLSRDAKRDIGAELLESIREMQAGKVGRVHPVTLNEVAEARAKSGTRASKSLSHLLDATSQTKANRSQ